MTIDNLRSMLEGYDDNSAKARAFELLDLFEKENKGKCRVIGIDFAFQALLEGRSPKYCNAASLLNMLLFFSGDNYLEVN